MHEDQIYDEFWRGIVCMVIYAGLASAALAMAIMLALFGDEFANIF